MFGNWLNGIDKTTKARIPIGVWRILFLTLFASQTL
jgi:hypothetical protein